MHKYAKTQIHLSSSSTGIQQLERSSKRLQGTQPEWFSPPQNSGDRGSLGNTSKSWPPILAYLPLILPSSKSYSCTFTEYLELESTHSSENTKCKRDFKECLDPFSYRWGKFIKRTRYCPKYHNKVSPKGAQVSNIMSSEPDSTLFLTSVKAPSTQFLKMKVQNYP